MAKETIEALLNPSLKVSRPIAACARCRSAKIKCDGRLPACSACERAGKAKDCSSANDEFARGKERSYVAALETVIQRLEKKIEEAKLDDMSRRQSIAMLTEGRPSLQPKPISLTRRREASSVDELVSDFGFLTVNATSRDFHGFSETMSFAKLLQAIAVKKSLPVSGSHDLPPRSEIAPLVDHYFENVHVLLPFFSETEFISSLSRVYQESMVVNVTPFDMWCVRLVLAISSASMCQLRGDTHYTNGLCHIAEAMKLADYVIYPGSLSGIQALLLLVQYSLADPEHLDSWYIVGMAARLLVDLGLHCEPAPETRMTKAALDLRRRIFYCTYALDRLVSMSLGFAFSFTDDSAPNVLLPTLATDQEARSPSQLFLRSVRPSLYLFDIRRVQSAFYQRTRWSSRNQWTAEAAGDFISSTLDDVQAWYSSLPTSFSHKHLQSFYLESLYTQLLALSPNQVIPSAIISMTHKFMFFQNAIEFSTHFLTMSQTTDLRAFLCYADFCRARYVSRQFQNLMWANFDLMLTGNQSIASPGQPASPLDNCNSALQFLGNMSQILEWPKQRWGISALQEIFEQESAVLRARLMARQQEYNTRQQRTVPPTSQASYQQQTISPVSQSSYQSSFNPAEHGFQPQTVSPTSATGYHQQGAGPLLQSEYHQQSISPQQAPYPQQNISPTFQTSYQQLHISSVSPPISYPPQHHTSPLPEQPYAPQIADSQSQAQLPHPPSQPQSYQPNVPSYVPNDANSAGLYSNSAMHRSNLLRATSWSPNPDQDSTLPPGSLPRRSYEFRGA